MHIPNGYLGSQVCIITAALAATGLAVTALQAARRVAVPAPRVAAATAAAIFAAQAVNFPVSSGTSGHLLGAMLAVLIAGPAAAVWILSAVVTVQCLLFGDGGLQALGANLINLALIAPLTGHWVVQRLQRRAVNAEGQLIAIGVASWLSVIAATTAAALQIAWSGTVPLAEVLPAMLLAHAKIGFGEMLLTMAVSFLLFDLLPGTKLSTYSLAMPRRTSQIIGGLTLITGIAIVLTPFASARPDGLEAVATKLGFDALEIPAGWAPFAAQHWPTLGNGAVVLTSLAGVVVVTLAVWFLVRSAFLSRLNSFSIR